MHRYSKYLTNEDIRDIQLIQLELLKAFHNYCEDHDLYYIAYSGTVIGAVRHKGFIPWDDDADVLMPREDYEKFIANGAKFLGEEYFVQNPMTDKHYPYHFTRIRKENTLMLQEPFDHIDMHHGVFIDVFPMDVYPLEEEERLKFIKSMSKHNRIKSFFMFKPTGSKTDFIKTIIKNILSISPYKKWYKRSERDRTRYNNSTIEPNTPQFAEFTIEIERDRMEGLLHTYNEVYDRILVPFEDMQLYIPRGYATILNRYFTDYTQFPPIEWQISTHSVVKFSKDKGSHSVKLP